MARERVKVQDDLNVTLSRGDQILIPNQVEQGETPTFVRPHRVECPSCRATVFSKREWLMFEQDGSEVVINAEYTCRGCDKVYLRDQLVER